MQPSAVAFGTHRIRVAHGGDAGYPPEIPWPQGDVLVDGERSQFEDVHNAKDSDERLTDGEIGEFGGPNAGAAPAGVVEQVVAIRRHAQLAQPGEHERRRCADRNRPIQSDGAGRDLIAWQARGAFSGTGAPSRADHASILSALYR